VVEQDEGQHLLFAKIEPVYKLLQPAILIIPMTGFVECEENTDVVFLLDHAVHLTKKHISPPYDCAAWALAGSQRRMISDKAYSRHATRSATSDSVHSEDMLL